jgi:hypothetical protein
MTSNAAKQRAYRQRIAQRGMVQIQAELPGETVAFIEELQKRQRLPNRSLALQDLVEKGRKLTEQKNT